ncbi:MAG: RHS repeat-associated core domain-containing protein, partial [Akkermansiaceae bacterium]|nr:RHS repeat-associated core domain-containing protein [Akkermansiaceae bacterium]
CWAERTLDDQGNELSRTECYSFFSAVDDRWVRTDRTSEFRDGVLTRRIEEEWMFFEWGEELLKSRTFTDPNNENAYLETVYAYYEDPADNGYRHVKWIIHPDGGWVKYDYTVDQVPSRIYRPWKNLPAHPEEATDANAQYEERGYTSRVDSPYPYFETELENSAHFLPGGQLVGASWFDAWSGVGFLPTNIRSFLESRIDGDDLVTRETWQESGLTGGAPLYSVTARYNDTHPQWPGRLVARLDPDGRSEVHFHTRGDYAATTAVFTANAAGAYVQEEIFEGTGDNPEGVLLDGKPATTRRTIIRDDEGRIRRDSLAVYEGPGTFSELQVTVFDHLFDASGAVAAVTERRLDPGMPAPGRVVRETTYDTPHQTTVIDEIGRATVTLRDELDRVQTVTTLGAAGDPDEVTTYARDGLVETVTRSVGPNVTTRTTIRDLAGRTVTEVDALGRVTSTIYPNGGRDTVATGPGGVAATTTRYLDGRTASVTGPGVVDTHYDYGLEGGFPATTVTRGATRWEKTVADHVGREYQRITPSPDGAGTVTVTTAYALDPLGGGSTRHPARRTSTAPQVPVVLSTYDLLGRATASGIDADADGTLTAASLDRLRTAERYFEHDGTSWWEVDVSKSYPADDSDAAQVTVRKSRLGFTDPAVLSETRVTLPTGETIATLRTVDRATATVTETRSTNLSDVDAVTVTSNGVLRSRTSHLSATPETWTYHRAGNTLETIHTDARGAVRRRIESSAGQVLTEIDPLGKHTYYLYYPADHPNAGRLRRTTNPAGETTEYSYTLRGEVASITGTAEYPREYSYTETGELESLTTHGAAGPAVTRWDYDPATGGLLHKVHNFIDGNGNGLVDAAERDGKATSYTYDAAGRLHERLWARTLPASTTRLTTTYGYNALGDLNAIEYNDGSTPNVYFWSHNRNGQALLVTQAGIGAATMTYDAATAQLDVLAFNGGHALLPALTVDYHAPDQGRPAGYAVTATGVLQDLSYSYDDQGRLQHIDTATHRSSYAYHPGTAAPQIATAIGYEMDDAGRRIRSTRNDGTAWHFSYNSRGEVTGGSKRLHDTTLLAGQQYEYDYDAIGNREKARYGGDSNGANLREISYTSNALNQYTSIARPDQVVILGAAPAASTLTTTPAATLHRQGDRFAAEFSIPARPGWHLLEVQENDGAGHGGHAWFPPLPVIPTHDADGNLLTDGRWGYTWNGENRLVEMETLPTAVNAGAPYRKLLFTYDWQGRRIAKKVYDLDPIANPGAVPITDRRFLYDAWNLTAEFEALNTSNLTLKTTYTWGLDLSNTLQGAGGVGGLLAATTHGGATTTVLPHFDGNGNIVAWSGTSGAVQQRLDYDPFGKVIAREGSLAGGAEMPFAFSTKYEDGETGMNYYGYRHYDPTAGRWPSRDPVGENGGENLHAFVLNSPLNGMDHLGLQQFNPDNVWGEPSGYPREPAFRIIMPED